MKPPRRPSSGKIELARLRGRLLVAEATLRAIRAGEVDTLVVPGRSGPRVFTLEGAEHPYRELIESMNEGALTLTADKTILYANHCLARLVRCPLEQVIGSSFRRFLPPAGRLALRAVLKRPGKSGAKLQTALVVAGSPPIPVQISVRPLAGSGRDRAKIGMVVTDMTEPRHTEELLRALAHRVVRAQEDERGRVALELHDNITQRLCAVVLNAQHLLASVPVRHKRARREAELVRDLVGQAAEEVERISRNLRPGVLEQLGLETVLKSTCAEFTARSGVPHRLSCAPLAGRLPAGIELALYRVLQEALKNVQRHARARHVAVALTRTDEGVQLSISDDGIGFDTGHHLARRNQQGVLGLLGMRERASYVGGTLTVKSGLRAGTEIEVRIPVGPGVAVTG